MQDEAIVFVDDAISYGLVGACCQRSKQTVGVANVDDIETVSSEHTLKVTHTQLRRNVVDKQKICHGGSIAGFCVKILKLV